MGTVDNLLRGLIASTDHSCIPVWGCGGSGQYDIGAAKVLENGSVSWTVPVCNETRAQENAVMIPDGNGGAYFSWDDNRNTDNGRDVYAQHIGANGAELWAHNGIPVIAHALNQNQPRIVLDHSNHFYCIWQDFRNGIDLDIYAQKLSDQGQAMWPDSGRLIASGTNDQRVTDIGLDNDNGLFVSWVDYFYYYRLNMTHLDSTGIVVNDPYWVPGQGGLIGMDGTSCVNSDFRPGDFLVTWGRSELLGSWKDALPAMAIYAQRVSDGFGVQVVREPNQITPSSFALKQNYPNPFNPNTRIAFDIAKSGHVSIKLYDLLGRQVATLIHQNMTAGSYTVSFDASRLPSGTYIYRLQSGSFEQSRKMTLIK
jgi:hypothetical protein